MQSKLKPFCQWEKLDMSSIERRKLVCSVTFHAIAVTCVIWSLYVLIDRTTIEIRTGELDWPFWTKLVVVVIGFTGGLVFMYIQFKVYFQLCRKWKAYNRIIVVQDLPPDILIQRQKAILESRKPGKEYDIVSDSTHVSTRDILTLPVSVAPSAPPVAAAGFEAVDGEGRRALTGNFQLRRTLESRSDPGGMSAGRWSRWSNTPRSRAESASGFTSPDADVISLPLHTKRKIAEKRQSVQSLQGPPISTVLCTEPTSDVEFVVPHQSPEDEEDAEDGGGQTSKLLEPLSIPTDNHHHQGDETPLTSPTSLLELEARRNTVETQTSLQFSSLLDESFDSNQNNDVTVTTISRLLEEMDCGTGSIPAVIFLSESEIEKRAGARTLKTRRNLNEPLLICDLPGPQESNAVPSLTRYITTSGYVPSLFTCIPPTRPPMISQTTSVARDPISQTSSQRSPPAASWRPPPAFEDESFEEKAISHATPVTNLPPLLTSGSTVADSRTLTRVSSLDSVLPSLASVDAMLPYKGKETGSLLLTESTRGKLSISSTETMMSALSSPHLDLVDAHSNQGKNESKA